MDKTTISNVVSFKKDYIAYAHIPKIGNRAFNLVRPIDSDDEDDDHDFWFEYSNGSLLRQVLKMAGDDFHWIEYCKGSIAEHTDIRAFLDIDTRMPDKPLLMEHIREHICRLMDIGDTDDTIHILQNDQSGKLHIVVNAPQYISKLVDDLPNELVQRNKKKFARATMTELGKILYDTIKLHVDISEADWLKAVDVANTHTLRAAHSVKIDKDGKPRETYDRYVVYGEPIDDADDESTTDSIVEQLLECSIYRPITNAWTVGGFYMNVKTAYKALVQDMKNKEIEDNRILEEYDYRESDKSIVLFGTRTQITKEFINSIINGLPESYRNGRRWGFICRHLRHVSALFEVNDYFLHDWSQASPEYSQTGNNNQWARYPADPSKSILSLIKLIKCQHQLTMYDHPAISQHQFGDYNDIGYLDVSDLNKLLRASVAFVSNGGRSLVYTRMLTPQNELKFTSVKKANLADIPNLYRTFVEKGEEVVEVPRPLAFFIDKVIPSVTYNTVDFMPGKLGPIGKTFNLFTGWIHPMTAANSYDISVISPVLDHIRLVWCRDDPVSFKYMISIFARILQKPAEKSDVAVILKSVCQGAGKGIIMDFIGKHVIGSKYYLYYPSVRNLVEDRFNSEQACKLISLIDETANSENTRYETTEKLKAIITRTNIYIEEKGKDKVEMADYNNYFFASNAVCPLHIDVTDRRYYVLDVSDEKATDKKYFVELAKSLNKDTGRHFFNYLMQYDISGFNPREIPASKIKDTMKLDSLSLPVRWLIEAIQECDDDEFGGSNSDVYRQFADWCGRNGHVRVPSATIFGREIESYLPCKVHKLDGKAVRLRQRSADDIRMLLKSKICADLDV